MIINYINFALGFYAVFYRLITRNINIQIFIVGDFTFYFILIFVGETKENHARTTAYWKMFTYAITMRIFFPFFYISSFSLY